MLNKATGAQGVVKCGAVPAASLRAWQMVACDDTRQRWSLTATAVNVNAFYITQPSLSISLKVGSRSWRWNDVALEFAGGKVHGILTGRPEVTR